MEEIDNTVNDLINQIKGNKKNNKKLEDLELNKETLEHFILNSTGLLVKNSVTFVDDVKDYVSASQDPEEMEALAKLIQASAAALESLNKIYISNEKNKTMKEVKQMDIDSKKMLQDTASDKKLLVNREELIKELLNNSTVIDADVKDLD